MISSTTNYNVREQEPAAEDIQFRGMERFSALIICQMNSPVDQGSNPPDTVSTEGHSSETSYKRLKDYLKGMKQKVSTCIRTINSFGRRIMFLTIVIIGTFGYNTNKVYWRKNNLSDSIVNTTFQDGTEERNLRNISIITHFWEIAETVMIDNIYGKSENDTHQTFVLQYNNKLVGVPRLRQVRVRNNSCVVRQLLNRSIEQCNELYLQEYEDTKPFGPGNGTAWTYSSAEELSGSSPTLKWLTYGGGGYYEDLSLTRNEAIEKLQNLKNNDWITGRTSAIFLDLMVYNPNADAILIIKVVFENSPTEGIITYFYRETVYLHQLWTPYQFFVAVCLIVALIFFIAIK